MRLSCLLLAATLLLTGMGFAHAASAANCTGSGALSLSLSPCPVSKTTQEAQSIDFTVNASVRGSVAGNVVVVIVDNAKVLQSFYVFPTGTGTYQGEFTTNPALAPGTHSGSLGILVCGDTACHNVYVQTSLPYAFTVKAIPSPVLTRVTPSSARVTNLGMGITVYGTNIRDISKVRWNGKVLFTSYWSSTRLDAVLPAGYAKTAQVAKIDIVTTPPWNSKLALPWKGVSNAINVPIVNPRPVISWVSPDRAYAGSDDLAVTIVGSNFNSSTTLWWKNTQLPIIRRSETGLQAKLPASALAKVKQGTFTVQNPSPGGGSDSLTYQVVRAPPTIAALSPGYASPGAGDFTLTVAGTLFDPDAVVYWNGNPLTTTFVSSTELQTQVPASDVTDAGAYTVAVINAGTGDASNSASFAVDATGTSVQSLVQTTNDVSWDPVNFLLYGSVPSVATSNANSIVRVDPVRALVDDAVATSSEPKYLSVSAESEYLYASFDTDKDVIRFALPAITNDRKLSFGLAGDLQASPVYPRVVAVAGRVDVSAMDIFVDKRFVQLVGGWHTIGWNGEGDKIYGGDIETTARNFTSSSFSLLKGPTSFKSYMGVWDIYGRMHVDQVSGLIYADGVSPTYGGGISEVLDPSTQSVLGSFPIYGVMIPDTALGCAYFVYQTAGQSGSHNYTIACYDIDARTLTRSMILSNLNGVPRKLVRWGNEGLALQTTTAVYFISGQLVTGN